ncbi:MBL fold metallo-hydrolase [Lachnospiraceae bacterium 54-53]
MKKGKELIDEINACRPEAGTFAFWWLGQMGFAVKLGGKIIYLDPFLSERPDRRIPPLLNPLEVTNADYILGSHDHTDHIDRKTWKQLSVSSPSAKFIVPKLLVRSLSEDLDIPEDRFEGLDDGAVLDLPGGIKISGIAASHEFLDRDPLTGAFPYLGYILEGEGRTLYHSGDTCIYEGIWSRLGKYGKFDVMFLPINGRDGKRYRNHVIGNMTYQEAADLAGRFQPGLVVPAHYEMFENNKEDPALFADYMDAKYPGLCYWIGAHGEMTVS